MKNKLTKHYCEAFIDAAIIGAKKHCDFLSSQPEFSETYTSKNRGHIIKFIALSGNDKILNDSFNNSPELVFSGSIGMAPIRFLDLITYSSRSGDLMSVKVVLDNFDKFKDNSKSEYKHSIDCALRHAGEDGHLDIFNHLLTIGGNPSQWHVIRWTAENGPKNTYERLLQANKLPPSTKREYLIDICKSEFSKGNFSSIDLSKY